MDFLPQFFKSPALIKILRRETEADYRAEEVNDEAELLAVIKEEEGPTPAAIIC